MKKFVSGLLLGALLFTGLSAGATSDLAPFSVKLFFKGKEMKLRYGEAMVHNGRLYVPIRDVAEWTETPVYWNGNQPAVSLGYPHSEIVNGAGEVIGSATFIPEEGKGVRVEITAEKLTPGKHGFHIHAQSFTGSDFKTAGGHFNPEQKQHGMNNPAGHHMGDLPNIEVKEDGTVTADILVEGVTLEPRKANSILGKSLIIHAVEDEGVTDPAGNAGDRVAGANIGQ